MKTEKFTPLQELLNLCHVPRWCIVPMLRPQNVAEHSFRVAAIASAICRTMDLTDLIAEAAVVGLNHDRDECYSGDIPSNYKHADSRGKPLSTPTVVAIVKLADIMESLAHLQMWGAPTLRRGRIEEELINKLQDWLDFAIQQWPDYSWNSAVHDVQKQILER